LHYRNCPAHLYAAYNCLAKISSDISVYTQEGNEGYEQSVHHARDEEMERKAMIICLAKESGWGIQHFGEREGNNRRKWS
jgi:hypothetical protein